MPSLLECDAKHKHVPPKKATRTFLQHGSWCNQMYGIQAISDMVPLHGGSKITAKLPFAELWTFLTQQNQHLPHRVIILPPIPNNMWKTVTWNSCLEQLQNQHWHSIHNDAQALGVTTWWPQYLPNHKSCVDSNDPNLASMSLICELIQVREDIVRVYRLPHHTSTQDSYKEPQRLNSLLAPL